MMCYEVLMLLLVPADAQRRSDDPLLSNLEINFDRL
jgi:hypothetical protein